MPFFTCDIVWWRDLIGRISLAWSPWGCCVRSYRQLSSSRLLLLLLLLLQLLLHAAVTAAASCACALLHGGFTFISRERMKERVVAASFFFSKIREKNKPAKLTVPFAVAVKILHSS